MGKKEYESQQAREDDRYGRDNYLHVALQVRAV
jgi:hypothetical protein